MRALTLAEVRRAMERILFCKEDKGEEWQSTVGSCTHVQLKHTSSVPDIHVRVYVSVYIETEVCDF